jgi:UDP-arabinose 4-epimerase
LENVIVTGGAGYIGSHACKALAEAGYRPITVDNLCLGHRRFVKWGPLIEADVRDTATLIDIMHRFEAVGVMHFAAFAYVGESVIHPAKYYDNNVTATLSVLAAMRETGLSKLVFSSTCAVYGTPSSPPITEETQPKPVNPYGRSKLMCETILADYASAYGIKPVVLRYFNASGADHSGLIGEDRQVETHLIPRAIMWLLGHVPDFCVFGADYPTPDGTAIRDYIHVNDLADAHVRALGYLLNGGAPRTFNLGVGTGYSVKQVLDMISSVTGQPIASPDGPRRPGDPPCLIADAGLALRLLGWTPSLSDLRTIIETAWTWHQITHPMPSYAIAAQ